MMNPSMEDGDAEPSHFRLLLPLSLTASLAAVALLLKGLAGTWANSLALAGHCWLARHPENKMGKSHGHTQPHVVSHTK